MKSKCLLLLAIICLPLEGYAYISSDGDQFVVTYNEHGAVLTTVHDKHIWIGYGAGSTTVSKKAVIFVGKNCDIASEFYGDGTWAWGNGGFIFKFGQKELAFARQELAIKNHGSCSM